MEFSEKIQKLRKQNNLTQDQLANKLFVSRTAVSKWESGKGYPSIDSLKDIAKIFNKTIDELLSSEEIIDIARSENNYNIKRVNNLIYGLLDIISVLFMFLPLYAKKVDGFVYSVALFNTNDISSVMKVFYSSVLVSLSLIGVFEIILNIISNRKYQRVFNYMSVIVQIVAILLFLLSRQVYLTAFVFILLIIKLVINNRF